MTWWCYQRGNPLVNTISNTDLSLEHPADWKCEILHDVVDVAKWTYYTVRTMQYLEKLPPIEVLP